MNSTLHGLPLGKRVGPAVVVVVATALGLGAGGLLAAGVAATRASNLVLGAALGLASGAAAWQAWRRRAAEAALEATALERDALAEALRRLDRKATRTSALEARNRELESFVRTLCHDLRSPMTSLRGFARLLVTDLAAGQRERVERDLAFMTEATDRMLALFDTIPDKRAFLGGADDPGGLEPPDGESNAA